MPKIPPHLPQFENRTILLITTGEKAGNLFIAKNGKIKKIRFVTFSSSKNFALRLILQIFAPQISDPETIRKNFLINLQTALKKAHASHKIHQTNLFCPGFMRENLENHLPKQIKEDLANVFIGNYTGHKPHQLIESIAQVRDQKLRFLLEKIIKTNNLPEETIYNKVPVISK